MKLSDLSINWEETIGNDLANLMAVDMREAYIWGADGKKTDNLEGWNVEVVCPKLKFDKITVKVRSKIQPFEIPDGEPILVKFIGLSGKAYLEYKSGQVKFAITAENVDVLEVLEE